MTGITTPALLGSAAPALLASAAPGPAAPEAAQVAGAFVQAVVDREHDTLAGLLADDVWFRSLLPRGLVEHHDRAGALGVIEGWFGGARELLVDAAYQHTSEGRELVGWRLRLRPEWEPEVWHLIEQVGYVRVAQGRVRRLDLVCTGFHPLPRWPSR